MSAATTTFDPLFITALLGGFIGMAVGLVTIWNQFRAARREQKLDIEASNIRSEGRLKEFFELKLQVVDNKIDTIKDAVKKIDSDYTNKLHEQRTFFSDWIHRVENTNKQ